MSKLQAAMRGLQGLASQLQPERTLGPCLMFLSGRKGDMSSVLFNICRMVETVVAELGGLHIAVNNAGINKNSAAEDTTEQDWDLTFDLNTKGVFLCCQVQHLFDGFAKDATDI